MFSSNSVLFWPCPMVSGFRDGKITVCLTKPQSYEKWWLPNSLLLLMAVSGTSGRKQKKLGKSLGSLASTQCWWPSSWCSASVLGNTSPPWGAGLGVHVGHLGPLSLTNPSFFCPWGAPLPRNSLCLWKGNAVLSPWRAAKEKEEKVLSRPFWPEYYPVYFRRGCCLALCRMPTPRKHTITKLFNALSRY